MAYGKIDGEDLGVSSYLLNPSCSDTDIKTKYQVIDTLSLYLNSYRLVSNWCNNQPSWVEQMEIIYGETTDQYCSKFKKNIIVKDGGKYEKPGT